MEFRHSLHSRPKTFNAYSILGVLVTFVVFSTRAEGLGSDAALAIPKHGPVFVARLGIQEGNASLKISVGDSQKARDSLYGGLGFLAVMDRDRTGPEGKPQVAFLFSQLPDFVRPCPMSGKARYHASIVQWAPGMSRPRQVLRLSRGRFEEHESIHKPVHQAENASESTASYSFAGVVSMESSELLHQLLSHPAHFVLRLAPCGNSGRVLRGELHSNVAAFMGLPKTFALPKSSAQLSPPNPLPTHPDHGHPLSSHEVNWQAYRAILTSLNLSSSSIVKDRDAAGSFSSHVSRKDVFSLHSSQEKSSTDPSDEGLQAAEAQLGVNDGMQQSENGIITGVDPEADAFAKQADQDTSSTADPMVGGGNPSATSSNQISSSMGSATNSRRIPDYGANFQSSAIDSTFADSRAREASNSHENELSNPLSGAGRIAGTSAHTGETTRPESILGVDGSGNTGYTANPNLGSDSNALSYGLGSVLTVVNEILGRDTGSFSGRIPTSSDRSGDQVYVRTLGLRRSGVRGAVVEGAYDPYAKASSTSSSIPATSSNLPSSNLPTTSATLPTSNSNPLPKPDPSLDNDSDTPKSAPQGRNPNLGTPLDPAAGSAVPASSFSSNPTPAAEIPAGFPGSTTGPQPNTGQGAARSQSGIPPLPGPQIGFDTAAPAANRPDQLDQTNLLRGLLGYFQTPSEFVPPPPPPPPPVIPRSTSATAGLGGDQFVNGGFWNGILPSGTGRMSMSAQDSSTKVSKDVDDVHSTVVKGASPPVPRTLPPAASPPALVVDASRVVSVVVQAVAYAASNFGF